MSLLLKRWTSTGDARHAGPGLEAGLLGTMPVIMGSAPLRWQQCHDHEWLGQMVKATAMLISPS